MAGSRKVLWLRLLTHLCGLIPLVVLACAYAGNQLGPDRIGEAMRRAGRLAVLFLLLSLTPTVVARVFGFSQALRVRRALGLYAFMYASIHFLIFIGLDYGFDFGLILLAVRDDRFILLGLAALVILAALALTSTKGWMKRLGKNWKRLHRAIYVAGALVVWHYAWSFKELRMTPIACGAVLAVLLVLRLPPVVRWSKELRGE
jgi:sulfoxide reductase heme-binding subunit YedZ